MELGKLEQKLVRENVNFEFDFEDEDKGIVYSYLICFNHRKQLYFAEESVYYACDDNNAENPDAHTKYRHYCSDNLYDLLDEIAKDNKEFEDNFRKALKKQHLDSKGLDALKELRLVRGWNNNEYNKRINFIESELERLYEIEVCNENLKEAYDEKECIYRIVKDKEINIGLWFSEKIYEMTYEEYIALKTKAITFIMLGRELNEIEFNLLKKYFRK